MYVHFCNGNFDLILILLDYQLRMISYRIGDYNAKKICSTFDSIS